MADDPKPETNAATYLGLAVLGETLHAASLVFQPWKAVGELKAALQKEPTRQPSAAPKDQVPSP